MRGAPAEGDNRSYHHCPSAIVPTAHRHALFLFFFVDMSSTHHPPHTGGGGGGYDGYPGHDQPHQGEIPAP